MDEIYQARQVVPQEKLEDLNFKEFMKKAMCRDIADLMYKNGVVNITENPDRFFIQNGTEIRAEVAILKVEELYRLKQIEKMFNMLQEDILARKLKFRLDDLCNTEAATQEAD